MKNEQPASNIKKSAYIIDQATSKAFIEFYVKTVDGESKKVIVAREMTSDLKKLHNEFLGESVNIKSDFKVVRNDLADIVNKKDRLFLYHVSKMGWQKNYTFYVSSLGVFGNVKDKNYLIPKALADKPLVEQAIKGTLESWKKNVALPLEFSSPGIVVMCAAFQAPLQRLLGLQPMGYNLHGLAKSGKTVALLAAASVGGIGEEYNLVNFKITESALDEMSLAFSDQLLPLNEMSTIDSEPKKISNHLKIFAYRLAEGKVKTKNSKSSYAVSSKDATFSLVFAATSEHSVQQYAANAERLRDDGELSRLIDIPVLRGKNTTVFDRSPTSVKNREKASWKQATLENIRNSIKENYGTALPVFINYLLQNKDKLPALKEECDAEFLSAIDKRLVLGAMQHALKNFCALYLAGKMAINAGILPWNQRKILKILQNEFLLYVQNSKKLDVSLDKKVKKILTEKLNSSKIIPKSKVKKDMGNIEGYYCEKGKHRTIRVKSSAFRSWFHNYDIDTVLKHLSSKKLIKVKPSYDPSKKISPFVTFQERWPNGTNDRSFLLMIPKTYWMIDDDYNTVEDDDDFSIKNKPKKKSGY